MTTTPIHHYTCDNVAAGYVVDEISGGTDLVLTGRTQVSGWDGSAISGGTTGTGYILGYTANVSFKAVSMWIKRINLTYVSNIICDSAVTHIFAIKTTATGNVLYVYNNGVQNASDLAITDTNWHHLWIVEGSDSSHHWFYLDGVKASSEVQSGISGLLRYFGRGNSATSQENVVVDNIQIYDRIPTSEEIAYLATATSQSLTLPIPDKTIVKGILEQVWGDAITVAAPIDQVWGIRFGVDLMQRWSDAPVIKGMLHQPWGNAGVIKAQLVQRWRDMVTLRAALDQPWAIMESLLVTLEQPWAITSGPVRGLLDQGWNIRDVEQVVAVLHQPWSIASDGTVLRYTVTVLADGQPVRVSHINIEGGLDDSGDVLTCELHLATEAEYLLCPFGAELAVTITSQEGTDSFAFVVVSPKPSEAHGNNAWVIEAMSPAVMLGAPYADVIDGELSGLASEIAATLAGDIALSWETVDWHIPAATWIASGETPLALLKTLAAAVGALVQSDPDGTIAIRPKYPISLPQWSSAIPDHVFTETLDCFENGATPEHRYGYNRFLVSNQSSSANSLTLEQTDISGSVKEVRGYQVPWGGLFDLTHTGGTWVVIEPMGIEERDETEAIEFVAGAGKVRYPLHGLVSVAWQQTNLGTITTAEDGSLTATISGQSLCEITYTTRCRLWKVTDSNNEQLQLVAEL